MFFVSVVFANLKDVKRHWHCVSAITSLDNIVKELLEVTQNSKTVVDNILSVLLVDEKHCFT